MSLWPWALLAPLAAGGTCENCNGKAPMTMPVTVVGLDSKITHSAPRKAAGA